MSKTALETIHPKKKFIERDCPRCESLIMKNEAEDCYECVQCGYIDCGTAKDK